MTPVSAFLLVIAAIFIIGIVGELVFAKTGVPDVVWLIIVGIFIGPVAGWVPREGLISIAPYFGALTLVVVLFDGGSQLRLADLGRAAPRASLVAIFGFSFSVIVLTLASMGAASVGWLDDWGWLQAITVGAILGGSSAVVVMPALRQARLGAKLSNIINIDSALTDVLCVVVTGACIQLHLSGAADSSQAAIALGKSFGIGLGLGLVFGVLGLLVLRRLTQSTYAYPMMLGCLLVLYVLVDELQGSAALAILAAAVIFGNAPALSKSMGLSDVVTLGAGVRDVHGQIAFIVKSFFFTFIGAMLAPPWSFIILGVLFGGFLLLGRVPAVFVATIGAGLNRAERGIVTVSMPRGMAAGVLAMMPATANPPMPGTQELAVVVFAAVVTSIVIFATGFPILRSRIPRAPAADAEPLAGAEPGAEGESSSVSEAPNAETAEEPGSTPAVEEAHRFTDPEPKPAHAMEAGAAETHLDSSPLGSTPRDTDPK